MKSKTLTAAALFIALSALNFSSYAAAEADKPGAMPMKPHAHAEEKTGVPQKPVADKPGKSNPSKNKAAHLHPRDGK